jgi:hypothetical protein
MILDKLEFQLSEKKDKKLKVYYNQSVGTGKWIHFGQKGYQHYFDKTGLLPNSENNIDNKRRRLYLARATKIKDGKGNLTVNDKNSANHYSVNYLW